MNIKEGAKVLQVPVVLVAAIWAAFLLERILPFDSVRTFGLVPRTANGAWGIVGMPFVHANLSHLIANTVPLLVLSTLLVIEGKGWGSVVVIVLLNGVFLWLFGWGGRVNCGASGLVYGLAALLIGLGLIQKKVVPLLIATLVAVLYGGALLSGVMPTHPGISWDGHLTGALAGICVATGSRQKKPQTPAGDSTS